jgi:cholinesterase
MNLVAKTTALALLASSSMNPTASAHTFTDLFVFGDSYSDTGAYSPVTNGSTAAGYLAQDFGITLTTSQDPAPGTKGINFAESGARVDVDPRRRPPSRGA